MTQAERIGEGHGLRPWTRFGRIVGSIAAIRARTLRCTEQFRAMAFAQMRRSAEPA